MFRPPATPLYCHGATLSLHLAAPSIVKSTRPTFPDETATSQVTIPEIWPLPGEIVLMPRPAPALAGSPTRTRTATTRRRWSAWRSVWRLINDVAADFMSVVSTRLVRAASPARVGCSTRKGLLSITYGIAALGRRCGHAEGSGTDSTRRFHEHARGVGSRSLGSFTPSTSQGSRPGRTTLLPIVGTRSSPLHRLPIPVGCGEKLPTPP